MARLKNIHPGEILKEEFLVPFGLNQTQLAKYIKVPPRRINEIILEKRAISANTALRLAKYFGISPKFWLGLQQDYDLEEEYWKNKKDLNQITTCKQIKGQRHDKDYSNANLAGRNRHAH